MPERTLAHTPLFAALDDEAAEALRATMTDIRIEKGDTLFHEGEPGDRLFVIVDGKIKLGASSGDGRETLLAVLGPGEMFGELSLFDPGPRTSTATALTPAHLMALGHDDLMPWLRGRPEVARSLLRALAKRPQDRFTDAEAMIDALDSLSLASASRPLPAPPRWAQTERIDLRVFQAPRIHEEIAEEDEDARSVTEPLPCYETRIAVAIPAADSDPAVPRFVRRWALEVIAVVACATALGVLAILLYTYLYDLPS